MNLYISTSVKLLASVTLIAGCAALSSLAIAETKTEKAPAAGTQKQFDDPKQAVDALVQAAASFDVNALKEILGPGSEDLVSSEDAAMDQQRATNFAAKAKEKSEVVPFEDNPNRAAITVGSGDEALPIPLVKNKGKWTFDTKLGRQEILNRRIGANELDVITICRGFVEAQHEYAAEKRGDAKINQYAQKIVSTPGKKDGLAWQEADGSWGGPIGEAAARALEKGEAKQGEPFHGYHFKVLKGQGPAAPMGEMDFVIKGVMIGGFALAAAPAQYRVTGVKTFMVGPDGIVYEKDLGPDTLKVFESMDRYNPDKTWTATEDGWPDEEEVSEPERTQASTGP